MSERGFQEKDVDYDAGMLSVNHRGFSAEAPENTLPAYRLSKKKGFRYVETDVSFTADGVPVLLHDSTIDRTSDGSGKIAEMTFAQVRQYDFGSWKSEEYAGTVIPTLAEFLELCRELDLYPYIELKKNGEYTRKQIESIIDLVRQYEMEEKTAYISFSPVYLNYVRDYDASARLGFLKSKPAAADLDVCQALKTSLNRVFYDVKFSNLTQEICHSFEKAKIPVEAWTVNKISSILNMHPYVSGITSDSQIAGKVLRENAGTQKTVKQPETGGKQQAAKQPATGGKQKTVQQTETVGKKTSKQSASGGKQQAAKQPASGGKQKTAKQTKAGGKQKSADETDAEKMLKQIWKSILRFTR